MTTPSKISVAFYDEDGALLTGLSPTFLQYLTLDEEEAIAEEPEITALGSLYEFTPSANDLITGVSYIIDGGATAFPRYYTGQIEASIPGAEDTPSTYVNEGIDGRAEVMQGDDVDTVAYWPKLNGAPVTSPTDTFATVYDQSGDVKVARAAVTPGSGGVLKVAQAWAEESYPLGEDYFIKWEWTDSAGIHVDRQYFDVVLNKLPCLIDTSDLQEFYPDIVTHLASIGIADASRFARKAWAELIQRIRLQGNRPSLILDKVVLIAPAQRLALQKACDALAREPEDIWDRRSTFHEKKYEQAFGEIGALKYDKNEDAVHDPADKEEMARPNRRNFTV